MEYFGITSIKKNKKLIDKFIRVWYYNNRD